MKNTLQTIVLGFLTTFTVQSRATAHDVALRVNEIVHISDAIFIGRVSEIRGFDGGSGMVGTEIVFTEIDALSTRPSANSFISEEVTLQFAGGSYRGVDASVCCQPYFELGEDYLVCTLLDGNTYLSPFSGGTQGLFRILQDEQGEMYPLTYTGRGIQAMSAFDFIPTPTVNQIWQGKPIYWGSTDSSSFVNPPRPITKGASAQSRSIEEPNTILTLDEFVQNLELARTTSTP